MGIPLPNTTSIVGWGLYIALLVLLSYTIPGRNCKGTTLADGSHLIYKCNGFNILICILIIWYLLTYQLKVFSPTILADEFGPFCVTVNIYAISFATWLYVRGKLNKAKEHGFVHDYVMGLELNPTFLGLDAKFFSLRPAMMGWLLINLSFLALHMQKGPLKTSMLLYQLFNGLYIVDYFWHEEYMTSTWDIVAEHFGLMLVWGDYVFIPFTFCLQNFVLLENAPDLSPFMVVLCLATFVIGYLIFRISNKQKHDFKHGNYARVWNNGKAPELVGGKLLVSGLWGWARHTNYLGDIILAVSYSLPTNSFTLLGWFYAIYLTILLIHRERRDEARCSEKYKELWRKYCERVPYHIVPYVY